MAEGSPNRTRYAVLGLVAYLIFFLLNCAVFWLQASGAWAEAQHGPARFLPAVTGFANFIMLIYVWAKVIRGRFVGPLFGRRE